MKGERNENERREKKKLENLLVQCADKKENRKISWRCWLLCPFLSVLLGRVGRYDLAPTSGTDFIPVVSKSML